MAQDQGGERTEQATPRRREEARKKGTVARSTDLTGAAGLLAAALVLPAATHQIGQGIFNGLNVISQNASRTISAGEFGRIFVGAIGPCLLGAAMLFGTVAAVGIAVNLAQVGFVLSAQSMVPSFKKIDPFAGFQRLFSARAGVEGLKAIFKMSVFGLITYKTVTSHWPTVIGLSATGPANAASVLGDLMHSVMLRISFVWFVLAVGDYLFQRFQVEKQLKMTKDELKQEMKDQEGNPEFKGERMKRRRKLMRAGGLRNVKDADVVLTNPTHYAVAIRYKRNEDHAPVVIAKGADYLAAKIREEADKHKVMIVPNPPLTRQIYRECDVGDYIPRELFGPVAEVLAFVYQEIEARRAPRKKPQPQPIYR
ncbi:MAG: EscU/YscU/HrcU family type III secretion system export apparatus switch protein [Armatimonadetes bacterium]|nr:EscU/YscU/HrcU family type III secretion system export apparatus switch protein [Armatimonadota bacterium]